MKCFLLFAACLSFSNSFAQTSDGDIKDSTKMFIRVFNRSHKKIAKGHLYSVTDSNVTLISREKTVIIAVKDIWVIETKRSPGSSFAAYAAGGTGIGILFLIAAGTSSAADVGNHRWFPSGGTLIFAGFALLTPAAGIITGTIAATSARSKTMLIEGNMQKWAPIKQQLLQLMKR